MALLVSSQSTAISSHLTALQCIVKYGLLFMCLFWGQNIGVQHYPWVSCAVPGDGMHLPSFQPQTRSTVSLQTIRVLTHFEFYDAFSSRVCGLGLLSLNLFIISEECSSRYKNKCEEGIKHHTSRQWGRQWISGAPDTQFVVTAVRHPPWEAGRVFLMPRPMNKNEFSF